MSKFTTGEVAQKYGVPTWKIDAAVRRGFIKPDERVIRYRMFSEESLPSVEDGLRKAGYLPKSGAAK
jgi:DNA-binding transcriptional MerR regulator